MVEHSSICRRSDDPKKGRLRRSPSPWGLWGAIRPIPWAMLFLLGCTACAGQPEIMVPPAMAAVPAAPSALPVADHLPEMPPPGIGAYHATAVTGDFAGYAHLEAFIERMAQDHGFAREYLMGLFSQARRKNWTLDYLAKSDQARKREPPVGGWTHYRGKFIDEGRVGNGVAFATRHRDALQRATNRYGVPEAYILGILAIETDFGRLLGSHRVLDALTTLGFDYARRGAYFREELAYFLLMSRDEGFDPVEPVGSYAGAMGLGQFMPSSFLQWAVDFNGDGRRDLWDAQDAIGSIANYLAHHGWQADGPVVTPLRTHGPVPVTLEPGLSRQYSLNALQAAGLRPAHPCRCEDPLRLVRLRHADRDQYLIAHANFYTLTRYNQSTYYAMTVHELAQAIEGRLPPPPLRQAMEAGEHSIDGFNRVQRDDVQN